MRVDVDVEATTHEDAVIAVAAAVRGLVSPEPIRYGVVVHSANIVPTKYSQEIDADA